MKKTVVVLMLGIASAALFAQTEVPQTKHKAGDLLLGIGMAGGVTPNISRLQEDPLKKGGYGFNFDIGLNLDYYVNQWFSVSTGSYGRVVNYVALNRSVPRSLLSFIWSRPLCLTIPLQAHINIPKAEWLYAGAGLTLNIPVNQFGERHERGDFFVGMPIDIGFDFTKQGSGGGRLFFRISPEFHEFATAFPVGIVWQIKNWQLIK